MELNRRVSLAGILALAAGPALPKPLKTAKHPSPWADVEAQATKMVADKLTPGVEICVRKKGAVIFSKGFGLADIETATPMSPASVCRIGSITKQFTASVILQLAHEGRLGLDDSLSVYIPDFPNAPRLNLRRMLSHTSGLGNYTDVPLDQFLQASRIDRTTSELVKAMADASPNLAYEPGTDWRYSNTAYVLLGVIIERVSGKSYAQALQERLFAPLGLTHTAVDDAAEVVPNRASGYMSARASASGFQNASFIAMSFPGGAGDLRATTSDLCAWHAALLGGKVLSPESLQAMLTPVTLNDGKLPTHPGRNGDKVETRYGFGVGLDIIGGHRTVSHGGEIQGFAAYLETLPDDDVTFAQMINTEGGPFAPPAFRAAPSALNRAIRAAALAV
jgi:CubicO group peptidase (beta-lactamase class C family)